jgi:hypothetical protein
VWHPFARRANAVDDRLSTGSAGGFNDPPAQGANRAAICLFSSTSVCWTVSPFLMAWHRDGIESRWKTGLVDFLGIDVDLTKSFFLSGLNQAMVERKNY